MMCIFCKFFPWNNQSFYGKEGSQLTIPITDDCVYTSCLRYAQVHIFHV
jgi:hypothetical protein